MGLWHKAVESMCERLGVKLSNNMPFEFWPMVPLLGIEAKINKLEKEVFLLKQQVNAKNDN